MYPATNHQIKSADDPYFGEFWKIYFGNFPFSERRTLEQQVAVFERPGLELSVFIAEGQVAGFIAGWFTAEFVFIEHFAIDIKMQGKGIGSTLLNSFIQAVRIPVILEIEPVVDIITRRRFQFYANLGFVRNDYVYFLPPYHVGDEPIRLDILTYPQPIDQKLYDKFWEFLTDTVMS